MNILLTSIVLCLAVQTASAQCVNSAPAAAGEVPQQAELIKTAAGATRHESALRQSPMPTSREKSGSDERRGRTGVGIVLAAVAVMSGIALRRASASGQ